MTFLSGGLISSWSDYYEYAWSPNSDSLVLANHVGMGIAMARGTDWIDRGLENGSTAIVVGEGKSPTSQTSKTELWLVDRATGQLRLLRTEPFTVIRSLAWLTDNQRIVYLGNQPGESGGFKNPICILDMRSGASKTLFMDAGQEANPLVSPDGTYVGFNFNTLQITYPIHDSIRLVDLRTTTESQFRIAGAETQIMDWSPDSRAFYARVQDDDAATPHVELITLSGRRTIVNGLPGTHRSAISWDLHKAAWTQIEHGRLILHIAQLSDDGAKVTQVVDVPFSEQVDEPQYAQGERRTVRWRSKDGTSCSGLLILPMHYNSDRRYPLLVMVHGGPLRGRGDNALFPLPVANVWDYWAGKGYAILAPNYRSDGSAGWNAILKARASGESFDRDFEDIMGGVDELIRQGIADPSHMAILGHSFGSAIVNWAITQTNRFRAAVSFEGPANFYWGVDANPTEGEEWLFGGSPIEKRSAYDRQSAIHHARGVSTPTLFIAGEFGKVSQQLAWMSAALRAQNVPSVYVLYRGEGHNLTNPAKKMDIMQRVANWIEKYVGH